ncbi:Uma2 family endonuclease [Aquisphaera insulae]|uniref:Uma2 family endonuclease n=1 Tax=Aquisphaera insulae TaxID=2712864 RepID=UPI0013EC69A0|nr:Uma2 family endonuclease [Aquisphaera insulae]
MSIAEALPEAVSTPTDVVPSLQDVIERLGEIPLSRILSRPAPGLATEADLLAVNQRKNRICELVDGVIVEKGMGLRESLIAAALISMLRNHVLPRKLGLVSGEAGTLKLCPGLIRVPDVAFLPWARLPEGRVPSEPMPQIAPELAIEVLSDSNTRSEMLRKREDYFRYGVDAVWEVDPRNRTLAVYERGVASVRVLQQSETLEAKGTLVGFSVVLSDLFAELDRTS